MDFHHDSVSRWMAELMQIQMALQHYAQENENVYPSNISIDEFSRIMNVPLDSRNLLGTFFFLGGERGEDWRRIIVYTKEEKYIYFIFDDGPIRNNRFRHDKGELPYIYSNDSESVFYKDYQSKIQIVKKTNKYEGKDNLLLEAISYGDLENAIWLIDHDIQLEQKDINQITPIMLAVSKQYYSLVKKLLEKKVQLEGRNIFGDNVFDIAKKTGNRKIIGLFPAYLKTQSKD